MPRASRTVFIKSSTLHWAGSNLTTASFFSYETCACLTHFTDSSADCTGGAQPLQVMPVISRVTVSSFSARRVAAAKTATQASILRQFIQGFPAVDYSTCRSRPRRKCVCVDPPIADPSTCQGRFEAADIRIELCQVADSELRWRYFSCAFRPAPEAEIPTWTAARCVV